MGMCEIRDLENQFNIRRKDDSICRECVM